MIETAAKGPVPPGHGVATSYHVGSSGSPAVEATGRNGVGIVQVDDGARVTAGATREGSFEGEPTTLSPSQRRLWFLNEYDQGDAYLIALATRFSGPLDVSALRAAHQLVGDRHEILRTRFEDRDGVATAIVDPPGPIEFTVEDVVEGTFSGDNRRSLEEFLAEVACTPFDLANGPVWRVGVGRLAPDDHVVVTVIHHIAADGWSFPVLRSEVSTAYRAIIHEQVPELPALPSQYRDLARGVDPAPESLEYWKRRFGDDPDPIPLLGDRPRPHRRTHHGDWAEVGPLQATSSQLREVANRCSGSPFMVGLALFSAFLGRICRVDEVIIGIPHVNRDDTPTQGLIGPFVNSVPLRIAVRGGASLVDQVAVVRSEMLAALDHTSVAFEEIVRAVAPRRDSSHTPLFQVMFQLHEGAFRSSYDLPGLTETRVPIGGSTSKFDLLLEMNAVGGPVSGSLNFSNDIFDVETGTSLARAFAEMTEAALAQPDAALDRLPLLDQSDRHWLIRALNASERSYPKTTRLWDLFEATVEAHGDGVAVADGEASMTYGQLHTAALEVALLLRAEGVGPGEPVGIQMERSVSLVTATLAVAHVGGAYVPLDPSYPEARRRQMIEQSGARFVARESDAGVELVSTGRVDAVALDGDPAYVMFTSGSTGRPKGTVVPQRAVARLVCNTDYVTLGPGDVIAHVSNTSFDAATFEIWGALLNGATLRILDAATVLAPAAFAQALSRHDVTTVFVTTALFNVVASHEPAAFASVRDVLFGGERCNVDAVGAVLSKGPPQRLVHVYGPTESTTFASWYEVPQIDSVADGAPRTVPIGGPVANTTLYVVDRGGELVPPGVVGELWIGGDGLALGYLGEPALTAERFGPDPFGEDPWGRLYRTGDLVRRRHDGAIEFVGRIDRQVKLRGFRIEPEEVERAVRSHADVADALVEVIAPHGDPRLAAWAVPLPGRDIDPSSILEHLRRILPGYMVPMSVGIVAAIPIGPNGKIDMALLPVPFEPSHGNGEERVDSSTSALIDVFEQVLGVTGVGPRDSFFDLGGHSLLAVELIAVAERRLGHRLPLASLFEDATPAGLARLLDVQPDGESEGLVTFSAAGGATPIFLLPHPSGTVLGYEPLARRIEDGLTVHGLQAQGVDGVGRPAETIEEMAEVYADRIEEASPIGSCVLAGHSLGGLLAWETARVLRHRGREVAMVALLDSRLPRRGLVELDGELRQLTRLGRLRRFIRRLVADRVYGLRYASYSLRGAAIPPKLARVRQIRSASRAFELYRPTPQDQHVAFFAARGSGPSAIRGSGPSVDEWRELAGSIEVVEVPGSHTGDDSILKEPNVEVLASEFRARITGVANRSERLDSDQPPARTRGGTVV